MPKRAFQSVGKLVIRKYAIGITGLIVNRLKRPLESLGGERFRDSSDLKFPTCGGFLAITRQIRSV